MSDCMGIRNVIERLLSLLTRRTSDYGYHAELLYLTRIDKDKATEGNLGVIESISMKPFPVMFTGDIHRRIFDAGDPFRRFYIVDVTVQTVKGAPNAYKVTRLLDIGDIED